MRIHILVEGLSEEAFLKKWLPRFLPSQHSYKIIPHRGKGKLPGDPARKPDPRRQWIDMFKMEFATHGNYFVT